METNFLSNRKPTEKELVSLRGAARTPILFTVFGEIGASNRYDPTALAVTADEVFLYDFKADRVEKRFAFSDIDEIFTKRMYGNGMLRVRGKDGKLVNLFRFTLTVAALADAAATFIRSVIGGESPDEAIEVVRGTYDKMLSVCPNCGRTLSSPGATCVHCMSKGRLLRRMGSYLRPEAAILIITIFLSIISTFLSLMPPILTQSLVDEILPGMQRNRLIGVSIALVLINVFHFSLTGIQGYMLRVSGNRIMARIRCEVYEKAQHLPMRFYDKTSTGAVINRISTDTATLQAYMLRITREAVVQFFKLVGIMVVMIVMNWKLALLALCPVPLVTIGARIFRRYIRPFYRRIWRRSSAVTSVLTDTIPGIRVVKSFTNEQNAVEHFNEKVEDWRVTDTKAGKMLNAYPAIISCFSCCGSVVIWALGGSMVINGLQNALPGALSVGLLVSFISFASLFREPVNFFANLSDSTQSAIASAERIMDILDAEPEHDFGKGNKNADMGGRIEFKHVNFSFDRTKKVLNDINLVIEPGDVVGIVGTTGSGKSTLVNLLLRYYDHYEGEITVDGVDIRTIDMQYYRSQIGYVQQEPMMFHDTIYNNIAYGDGIFTVDEVINAADIANAHEFIVRQPDGYDSMLGERGVGLSGGEKLRLSIARAMLRNPRMLVFDEATASVDSETEHLIQEAIERLISGRTTIMIAHRLSTLSKANKIVVVDNGRIIECGTPEEQLAMKGKYYRLVEIQSMSDKVEKDRRAERF